jgi:hypothetical protein
MIGVDCGLPWWALILSVGVTSAVALHEIHPYQLLAR